MWLPEQPSAIGCMRLSAKQVEEAGAVRVIHAALDAGITLLDTADVYAPDARGVGHNEKLIAQALASWTGSAEDIRIVTKGGLVRAGRQWRPDGRAKHLAAACSRSRNNLNLATIDLYLLHAPDPKTPLATSARALARLKSEGLVQRVGLSNVNLGQIEQVTDLVEVSAVQVELNPFTQTSFRNGVAEFCRDHQVPLLAHRPLGGVRGVRRLTSHPVLQRLAEKHRVTPAVIVLAWLRTLSHVVIPLPGPTQPETAASLGCLKGIRLSRRERDEIDSLFPAGKLLRTTRRERCPVAFEKGDVVIIMGSPAAGKSTLAAEFQRQGYERLNRDQLGGRVTQLVPKLDRLLKRGLTRVVLDNTYPKRDTRNEVIETCWRHRISVRCVWCDTSPADAQVNACIRMLHRYRRLLDPEEMRATGRSDPAVFGPSVLFRFQRSLEEPSIDEGFDAVETRPFEREWGTNHTNRAIIVEYAAVRDAPAAAVEKIARFFKHHSERGFIVLVSSWEPAVSAGRAKTEEVQARIARALQPLGVEPEIAICPHADGPPVCWCRKPLPGLGVHLIERHKLNPASCIHVGHRPADRTFAERLGFRYQEISEIG